MHIIQFKARQPRVLLISSYLIVVLTSGSNLFSRMRAYSLQFLNHLRKIAINLKHLIKAKRMTSPPYSTGPKTSL